MEAVTAGASSGFGSLAGAAASFTGGADGVGGLGAAGAGSGTLTPEFVDGLSKRLTTAEMKGIIQLTERGRRLEGKAGALQAEKEDLYARLQVIVFGGGGRLMKEKTATGLWEGGDGGHMRLRLQYYNPRRRPRIV